MNGSWTTTGDNDGVPYVERLAASLEEDSVLQLTNLTEADTGLYSCMVKNQYGGAVSTGWLHVSRATLAAAQPSSHAATRCSVTSYTCHSRGNGDVSRMSTPWLIILLAASSVVAVVLVTISVCFFRKYRSGYLKPFKTLPHIRIHFSAMRKRKENLQSRMPPKWPRGRKES